MTYYRHRQFGSLILWSIGIAAGAVATTLLTMAGTAPGAAWPLGIVLALLVTATVVFGSLTVEVTGERVELRFGPGWIRRRYVISEIVSAEAVRNRWYYGWGIRMIPGGWLFNVSGLEAVELRLVSGRRVRIGTDEPQRLLTAIADARPAHG